eukprot:296398_1
MSVVITPAIQKVKQKKKQMKQQQDWAYECNKLNKRYDVIEKQLQSVYRDGNPLSLEFKDIFDWNQLMHSERMKLKKGIHKQLATTSNLVTKFEHVVSNIKPNNQLLDEINCIADQIEDELMIFNTNHEKQVKELENAEHILWRELCTTTERLDTFEKDISHIVSENAKSTTPKFAKKRALNKCKFASAEHDSRPQTLIDIQKKIDEHGRYGGWPSRDHDDFLKLYSQILNDKELLHQLSEVMPQYTLSELREHLIWFDQYERLWERKRQIIKEWKEIKKQQKAIKTKTVSKHSDAIQKDKRRKQKQIQLEQQQKKKMIKEWKEQKEQEELEQTRIRNEAMRRKQLKLQKLAKERVREQKRLLLELSEKKKLNELVEKTTKPSKNLKCIKNSERNKELLIKFRTKDMLLVSKKKEAINKKLQKERDRAWRMVNLIAKSQPDIKVTNDKQRLLKMTEAAKTRMELKSKEKSKGSTKGKSRMHGYTQSAARAVPSWRRGL